MVTARECKSPPLAGFSATLAASSRPARLPGLEGKEKVRTSPPSLLRSYGAAPTSLTLHRGSPRRSVSEGGWLATQC